MTRAELEAQVRDIWEDGEGHRRVEQRENTDTRTGIRNYWEADPQKALAPAYHLRDSFFLLSSCFQILDDFRFQILAFLERVHVPFQTGHYGVKSCNFRIWNKQYNFEWQTPQCTGLGRIIRNILFPIAEIKQLVHWNKRHKILECHALLSI